ncbi:hypothetical protein N8079_01735 [Crocinitomicaceae bacterium]|nr:hypothetical protein [Crocinitomicaceae bacterium]
MKIESILLFIIFFVSYDVNAQTMCDFVSQKDYDGVEKLIEERVKTLHKDASFHSNRERLDSLEAEINRSPCVIKAYWNKNSSFTLNTLQFIHKLAIQFNTSNGILEKCYSIQTYFSHSKRKGGNDKLTYIKYSDCEGFIKRYLAIDSTNAVSAKKQRQNSICKIEASLIEPERNRKYPIHIYSYEEGMPINVKLTIQNFSDSVQNFIWPINQNCGKKIIYFELLNSDGSSHLIENRDVTLPNNELIPYDILILEPMEKRTFTHTINGFVQKNQTNIEAHHNLGPLLEEDYMLKVWYDPNPLNEAALSFWKPIELDTLQFRYTPKLKIIRSRKYSWEQYSLKYQDSVSALERSQACFKIKIISGPGNYYYDTGQNSYDGVGIIEEVTKGYQSIGDTIAFSYRYAPQNDLEQNQQDSIKQMISQGGNQEFWIYATNSFANYYHIIKADPKQSFLNGKRNYQLINYQEDIKKKLLTKPKLH